MVETLRTFKVFQIRSDTSVTEMGAIAQPTGVFAIHIRRIEFPDLPAKKPLLKMKVTVGDVSKETDPLPCGKEQLLDVDALMHFHVEPSCFANDISNKISVDMLEIVEGLGSWTVANLPLHLYDMMAVSQPMKEFYPIINPLNDVMAMVELEMCFKYGDFGYGYSNQLDLNEGEVISIETSLLPRVNPIQSRQLNASGTAACEPVGDPFFLNKPKLYSVGALQEIFGDPILFPRGIKKRPPLMTVLKKIQARVSNIQSQYAKFNLRQEKLNFLKDLVNGY